MRTPMPPALAILAALTLSACAPGDLALTQKDIADRARGFQVMETGRQKIPYHGSARYGMTCPSGMALLAGRARIANVGGTWDEPRDYRLVQEMRGNGISATVIHVGGKHFDDAPFVVVEMVADCRTPARTAG